MGSGWILLPFIFVFALMRTARSAPYVESVASYAAQEDNLASEMVRLEFEIALLSIFLIW